jgi:hypothetical protein
MLERPEAPVSRRWWLALIVIAAVVIPMQLVARMPAEPPQQSKPRQLAQSDSVPNRAARTAQDSQSQRVLRQRAVARRTQQGQQAAPREVAKAAQVGVRKVQIDDAAQAQRSDEHQTMIELMALVEKARAVSTGRAQALQTDEHKRLLADAIMELIRTAAARRDANMLRNTLTIADAIKLQNDGQQTDLARQYRELADHYERLAAEQRKLADEFERLQRESNPAK